MNPTRQRTSRSSDLDTSIDRGVWGKIEYVPGAGSVVSVRGTDTIDYEIPLLNIGYAMNYADDTNAEILTLSVGSDVNDKVAIATIPRDLQHPWAPGTGGVQHPSDPDRRIEFGAAATWLRDGAFVFGDNQSFGLTVAGNDATLTVAGGQTITIGGDGTITIAGAATIAIGGALTLSAATVDIASGTLTHNGVNVGATHTHAIAGGLAPSISGVPQ